MRRILLFVPAILFSLALQAGESRTQSLLVDGPGHVPDGSDGAPLLVGKNPAGGLDLSWATACGTTANDYSIHAGTLGSWYDHDAVACSTGSSLQSTIGVTSGDSYYLIAPLSNTAEGGYGEDSGGGQRPPSSGVCRPTNSPCGCGDCSLVAFQTVVSTGSDDAEESVSDGQTVIDSSDLELVFEDFEGIQQVGVRFSGITVPAGTTIANASIEFTARDSNTGASDLTIRGEATGNPPTFAENTNNISSRTTTTAVTPWQPPAWSVDSTYDTPDLSAIVQEIVDRGDWAAGQAMAFFFTGSGQRSAWSFDGSGDPARLHVEYVDEGPGGGDDPSGTACITMADCKPVGLESSGYAVTFSDEFNGSSLDSTKWVPGMHWYVDEADFPGDGGFRTTTTPDVYYLPENLTVADGILRIEARHVPGGINKPSPFGGYKDYFWTSGSISTSYEYVPGLAHSGSRCAYAFRHGFIEARIKIPDVMAGWTQWWTRAPEDWPPEIDILETIVNDVDPQDTSTAELHVHKEHPDNPWGFEYNDGTDYSEAYHTFGVEWTANHIRWFIDGVPLPQTFTEMNAFEDPPGLSHYLVMMLGLGPGSCAYEPGGDPTTCWPKAVPDPADFPAHLDVEYIRVWQ